MQICGDFNISLNYILYLILTNDPKYHQAVQQDKQMLAQFIQDFDFISLHYNDKYQVTFGHDHHTSRIDFVLMRKCQIECSIHQPKVHYDFELNFDQLGIYYFP